MNSRQTTLVLTVEHSLSLPLGLLKSIVQNAIESNHAEQMIVRKISRKKGTS